MPNVNIYLPAELEQRMRAAGISPSVAAQDGIRAALASAEPGTVIRVTHAESALEALRVIADYVATVLTTVDPPYVPSQGKP